MGGLHWFRWRFGRLLCALHGRRRGRLYRWAFRQAFRGFLATPAGRAEWARHGDWWNEGAGR